MTTTEDLSSDASRTARAGSRRERFLLYGHSAGGQVVHRLMTFGYSRRLEKVVAANCGSYTLPVFD